MPTFTDDAGRVWFVRLTIPLALALRDQRGIDVMSAAGWERLTDPVDCGQALTGLCQREWQARLMDAEDFQRLLCGDVLGSACMALFDAIAEFFPERTSDEQPETVPTAAELWARVFKMAGVVGIDPTQAPLSLRELLFMVIGRRASIAYWGAELLAMIGNANREKFKGKGEFSFRKFLPSDLKGEFPLPKLEGNDGGQLSLKDMMNFLP